MSEEQESKKDQEALKYHQFPVAGKMEIVPTKPLASQNDLSLAYSPGVAAACNAIVDDPARVSDYTIRSNLVGVVTNGTAVLGLGNIGPLASKPVMEGKAVLFKNFSGINVFDIEINEPDVDKFVDIVASLEPTFGGINLEDIKAPECFEIEKQLRERMSIPVMHDDQHGTAIIVAAAVLSGLKVVGKNIGDVRLVASGAGAAALACLNQLVSAGLRKENIIVNDSKGVIHKGRSEELDEWKAAFAIDTELRTLEDAIKGADIFLGLSGPGILKPEMVKAMADKPIIMALANPVPEILPEVAKQARPDAIICTGRSDYPNQVNNVLCFPFIFRGALDVGATTINEPMKLACINALAKLAQQETSDTVLRAYGGEPARFGSDYIIPKPFDHRLIVELASAVAQAAMDSGVATRPIENMHAYRQKLQGFVFRSGLFMRPIFEKAKDSGKKLVYAEGEDYRVLQAAQQIVDDNIARPILIGVESVIEANINKLGLRMLPGKNVEIIDPQNNPYFETHWKDYHVLMGRQGVTPSSARYQVRNQNSLVASLLVATGEADAVISGVIGGFQRCLDHVMNTIGKAEGVNAASTLMVHLLPSQTLFICDAHVTPDPTAEELAEMTILCAEEVRGFGMVPKVALLSHSSFGTSKSASSEKVRKALQILHKKAPDLEVDGEMHADAALSENIRNRVYPNSKLKGTANLLVMPNADAANITVNLLKVLGSGVTVGPILVGMSKSAHVITQSATVRSLVNMSALAIEHAICQQQNG
jgi:malate dehydrogenase (oxaloacetate-decarboxylating)(NADP+)